MKQQEVDLLGTKREDTFDKAITSHLDLGVRPKHLDSAVIVLHHEINSTICVDKNRLSYHLTTFADVHIFELALLLLKVRVEFHPFLLLLFSDWRGEPQWRLLCRSDAVVDDAIVVLSDKCHV
jgi:hypothetical protein